MYHQNYQYYFQYGEMLAKQCLLAGGYTVIDRRDSPYYWAQDIDMTAYKDNFSADIEVKWDTKIHNSGNLFFELLTNIDKNELGWASYTTSDYIWYGDAQELIFYSFRAEDMRDFLKNHKGEYATREANDYNNRDGTIRKKSLGATVPLSLFRKYYHVQEINIRDRLAQQKSKDF